MPVFVVSRITRSVELLWFKKNVWTAKMQFPFDAVKIKWQISFILGLNRSWGPVVELIIFFRCMCFLGVGGIMFLSYFFERNIAVTLCYNNLLNCSNRKTVPLKCGAWPIDCAMNWLDFSIIWQWQFTYYWNNVLSTIISCTKWVNKKLNNNFKNKYN